MLLVVILDDDDEDEAMLPSVTDDDSEVTNGDSSWSDRIFSSSLGSLAKGRSCLFAKIKTGVP